MDINSRACTRFPWKCEDSMDIPHHAGFHGKWQDSMNIPDHVEFYGNARIYWTISCPCRIPWKCQNSMDIPDHAEFYENARILWIFESMAGLNETVRILTQPYARIPLIILCTEGFHRHFTNQDTMNFSVTLLRFHGYSIPFTAAPGIPSNDIQM